LEKLLFTVRLLSKTDEYGDSIDQSFFKDSLCFLETKRDIKNILYKRLFSFVQNKSFFCTKELIVLYKEIITIGRVFLISGFDF